MWREAGDSDGTVSQPANAGGAVSTARDMRWPVVGLLSLGMMISYFDRVNLTVALPSMAAGFGLDKAQQGLALSAVFWAYAALQIPGGALLDRYGVRIPYLV